MPYTKDEKDLLLSISKESITYGLNYRTPLPLDPTQYSEGLQQQRASFVTLNLNQQLRGCIGSLQAHQPLVQDVAHNAFAAAFQDSRFYPVSVIEAPQLDIHISVLTPPEPMSFQSEEDLISQLRPNVDGLILSDQGRRGTFLPAVWEQIPDPKQFLQHLKMKAGLLEDYWSDTIQVERYEAEVIE